MLDIEIKSDELVRVEKGILDTLKDVGFDIETIDFKQLVEGEMLQLSRPAALITSNAGSFKRVAQRFDMLANIQIYLVIHNLQNNASFEFQMASLVKALFDFLSHNYMGLRDENGHYIITNGLVPVSYSDITSFAGRDDLRGIGFAVYECVFIAQIPVTELPQPELEDRGRLKRILMDILKENDSIPIVESQIDFNIIDGGNAYTDNFDNEIDGGSAGSEFEDDDLEGGNAKTDYNG